MAGRLARGWEILGQSWAVVRQDKELLLLPVMSSAACLIVLASFALPLIFATDLFEQLFNPNPAGGAAWQNVVYYALLFAFYFANYLVIVFFNTALVACAIIRFKGGNPSIGDGLGMAVRRFPQIVGWALVSATVGMVLRILEERLSFLGKIVVALIGVAWSIAAYFVIPVLAVEGVGPFTAVRRSAALLRKAWGEALTGGVSIGFVSFLLALPGIALILLGVALGMNVAPANALVVMLSFIALGVVYLIGLSIVLSTLQQIFLAGVYLYAAEGRVPDGFSEDSLRTAFKAKK